MSNKFSFKVPDEHFYLGMRFCKDIGLENDLRQIPGMDLNGDIIPISYPKTGTHWVKYIVWILLHDGDTEGITKFPLDTKARYMDMWAHDQDRSVIDVIKEQPHPRLMHSHLVPRYFSKEQVGGQTKFIISVRNPKDTLVSYYHFYRALTIYGNFPGTWDEFFELIKNDEMVFGDFFDYYMQWLPYINQPNVMVLHYEDMKKDLANEISRVAAFLDVSMPEEKIQEIASFLHFDNMKERVPPPVPLVITESRVAPFMRKGVIGDWRSYFSKEQSDYIDMRYRETLEKSGFLVKFD